MKRHARVRLPIFAGCVGVALWMGLAAVLMAAETTEEQAPGRTLAQQAVKEMHQWNTTDHSKHKALQRTFATGREITDACLSCHSEAEAQFHKTIHWTWLATRGTNGTERRAIR